MVLLEQCDIPGYFDVGGDDYGKIVLWKGQTMLATSPFDVSVIVPMYNCEDYVGYALKSALDQKFSGTIEIIAVDDGSTDDTLEAARDVLAGADVFARLLKQRHGGVATARNRALDLATGEYVAFLDADDQLMEGFCEEMVNAARTDRADLVIGSTRAIPGRGDLRSCADGTVKEFGFSRATTPFHQDFLARLFWDEEMGTSVWGKLYRRCLLGRFSSDYYFEDCPFNLSYIRRCRTITTIAEEVYCYREGAGIAFGDGKYLDCGWEAKVVEDCLVRRFVEGICGAPLHEKSVEMADAKLLRDAEEAIEGGTDRAVIEGCRRYRQARERLAG